MILIAVAILPVMLVLGLAGFVWYHWASSRAAADRYRARVAVGSRLGEAILASEPPMDEIGCFQSRCVQPSEVLLAHRGSRYFQAFDGREMSAADGPDEWRRRLLALDAGGCRKALITYCGRPWMSFGVELDEAGRVTGVGEMSVSSD
jgi:hypothetical protein